MTSPLHWVEPDKFCPCFVRLHFNEFSTNRQICSSLHPLCTKFPPFFQYVHAIEKLARNIKSWSKPSSEEPGAGWGQPRNTEVRKFVWESHCFLGGCHPGTVPSPSYGKCLPGPGRATPRHARQPPWAQPSRLACWRTDKSAGGRLPLMAGFRLVCSRVTWAFECDVKFFSHDALCFRHKEMKISLPHTQVDLSSPSCSPGHHLSSSIYDLLHFGCIVLNWVVIATIKYSERKYLVYRVTFILVGRSCVEWLR